MRLDLGAGSGIDLVLISAGEFTQGSPADEPGRGTDETQRIVRLTHDYYISRTAITRGQWERFAAETGYRTEAETGGSGGFGWDGNTLTQRKEFTWRNPGFPQDASHPVGLVTYPDAQAFCQWLERKSNRKAHLPTEAQWEYACRAGTNTPWHSGFETLAWHKGNSGNGTHPADSTPSNARGLVIGGNVSEWCSDWYAPYDPAQLTDPRQDNQNLSEKPRRVLRGGSWNRDVKNTRSAARFRADPRSRNADIGFRIVCEADVMAAVVETPLAAPGAPPVRVDPATTPPVDPPAPRSHSTPIETHQVDHGIRGWLCLLIPIGLLIVFVRLVTRRSGNPTLYEPMLQRKMPPPINVGPRVRTVDNGFWINSDLPVGTPILLSYVVNGVIEQQALVYQPGSEGQFIFTGQRPDNVSISEGGSQPPQLPPEPAPLFGREDDSFQPSVLPSFNPPAY
jgi:formylglycine-generating enzyme required for sulfatase activity